MTKFENQVALNKISRLIKNAPLVIFFHCPDRTFFEKKVRQSFVPAHHLSSSIETTKQIKASGFAELEDFTIKLLKNNYVKKALFEKLNNCDSFSACSLSTSSKQNRSPTLQEENSLFKGNRLAFFLKEIKNLKFAKKVFLTEQEGGSPYSPSFISTKDYTNHNFVTNEKIQILGGIYEDKIIDHNQVKRLLDISEPNTVFLWLIKQLNFAQLSFFANQLQPYNKLIYLFKQKKDSLR